jgi:hypothetical protein
VVVEHHRDRADDLACAVLPLGVDECIADEVADRFGAVDRAPAPGHEVVESGQQLLVHRDAEPRETSHRGPP